MQENFNWRLEQQFVESYYSGVPHDFNAVLPPTPQHIKDLYKEGKLEEYGTKLREWKLNELRSEYNKSL